MGVLIAADTKRTKIEQKEGPKAANQGQIFVRHGSLPAVRRLKKYDMATLHRCTTIAAFKMHLNLFSFIFSILKALLRSLNLSIHEVYELVLLFATPFFEAQVKPPVQNNR